MAYRVAVLVHLLGVVLFFCNLALAFGLVAGAGRAPDRGVLLHSYRVLHRADLWLTPISLVLMLGGGIAAADIAGLRMLQPWITRPALALGISGVLFTTLVLPVQRRLSAGAWTVDEHPRLRSRWLVGAALSTAAALAALVMMVLVRPS